MTGVVLNTRPREQAAELTRLLTRAGFEVLEAPAIETLSAWDPAELQAARGGVYDWVVLASQNAGRELVAHLGQALVVCGEATARTLGITPAVSLDRFSAAAALEVLRPRLRPGQRILVPRAAEGSAELIQGLLALGAVVEAPIAYRTVQVEPWRLTEAVARLQNGGVQAVTVCSPSALNSLRAAAGHEALRKSKLICLGETTAQAAGRAGLGVDGVAQKTTMAALVEAVCVAVQREVVA